MVFIRGASTAIRVVDQRCVDLGCRVVNGDCGVREAIGADERDGVSRVGCKGSFRNGLLAAIGDCGDEELGCRALCTGINGDDKPVRKPAVRALLCMDFDGARNRNPARCRLPGVGNCHPACARNDEVCACIDAGCTDLLRSVVSKGVAGFVPR